MIKLSGGDQARSPLGISRGLLHTPGFLMSVALTLGIKGRLRLPSSPVPARLRLRGLRLPGGPLTPRLSRLRLAQSQRAILLRYALLVVFPRASTIQLYEITLDCYSISVIITLCVIRYLLCVIN